MAFVGGPLDGDVIDCDQPGRPQEWHLHPEYHVPDIASLHANPNQPRVPLATEHRYRYTGERTKEGHLKYVYQGGHQ